MNFFGSGRRLSAQGIERAAALVGCEPAAMRAVIEVEAAGSGFDAKGRPKILFEPHIFFRLLSGKARAAAVEQGLAYRAWGERPYPRSSEEQYRRLALAMRIDPGAALKSASWGLPQIMGGNHAKTGFASPEAMVSAMMQGEDEQLAMMAQFIVSTGLAPALRARQWAAFAKGYNGAGYAKNSYDKKLASAYARFAKAGRPVGVLSAAETDDAKVRFAQERLQTLGYFEVGVIDGLWGSRTRGALLAFKADNGLPLTASIDEDTILALGTADPREVDAARATASAQEVAEKSGTAASARASKFRAALAGFGASISGALWGTLEAFGPAAGMLAPAKEFLADIPPVAWFALAAVVAFTIWRSAGQTEARVLDDFRAGKKP
jgi:hypothetical protein